MSLIFDVGISISFFISFRVSVCGSSWSLFFHHALSRFYYNILDIILTLDVRASFVYWYDRLNLFYSRISIIINCLHKNVSTQRIFDSGLKYGWMSKELWKFLCIRCGRSDDNFNITTPLSHLLQNSKQSIRIQTSLMSLAHDSRTISLQITVIQTFPWHKLSAIYLMTNFLAFETNEVADQTDCNWPLKPLFLLKRLFDFSGLDSTHYVFIRNPSSRVEYQIQNIKF